MGAPLSKQSKEKGITKHTLPFISGHYGKGIFVQAAKDFVTDQGIQIEGILCVFRNLHSAELGQKIRCPVENQFFIVTVK